MFFCVCSWQNLFMKVQVLFFGATAVEVGKREIDFEFETATKAGEAFAEIVGKFPALARRKLLFAINQQYSNGDEAIQNGDELAVFTAVSGG